MIFGSISVSWGVLFFLFMPDLPSTAWFLSPEQRVTAVERVAVNRQGIKNHHFKRYQMWQAVRDPKTWILFFMSIAAQIPNAAQSSVSVVLASVQRRPLIQAVHLHHPRDLRF